MISPVFIIIFNFVAGTACLMFGVNLMSGGLEKANTRVMKSILTRFTDNVLSAFTVGTLITALVQSSTAVTVITVGFVNSGLMKLSQAVGIIYGANIGTTITAQLMSFKITDFALPILLIGLVISKLSTKQSIKNIGVAIIGFGFMFLGISILNWSVPYIKESRIAYELFKEYGTNPYIGLFIGMLATMLVHSSGATVGLTIVLFGSNLISFEAAMGLTLGDNIGTCITAQLASLGTSISARRTAWAHTVYNIIGVIAVLIFFSPFIFIVRYATSLLGQDEIRLVANAHTIFNILSAAVFLPLTKYYVRFMEFIIPEKRK
ncbi:MAG: Na/Pi cotransporter family protein [Clostridia bacterium]|nr:Na/Pi cotransporter family protein [Clostridia bacterium]